MKLYVVKTEYQTVGIYKDPVKAIEHANRLEPVKEDGMLSGSIYVKVQEVESDWS